MKVEFRMFLLAFSNTNIYFVKKKFFWESYIVVKALLITQKIEFVGHKKFKALAVNPIKEIFVMHIAALKASRVAKIIIYPI